MKLLRENSDLELLSWPPPRTVVWLGVEALRGCRGSDHLAEPSADRRSDIGLVFNWVGQAARERAKEQQRRMRRHEREPRVLRAGGRAFATGVLTPSKG